MRSVILFISFHIFILIFHYFFILVYHTRLSPLSEPEYKIQCLI